MTRIYGNIKGKLSAIAINVAVICIGLGFYAYAQNLSVEKRVTAKEYRLGGSAFTFWHAQEEGNEIYKFRNAYGVLTTLDVSQCSEGSWCCNASEDICYLDPTGTGDAELQLKITGAPGYACTLLHWEDDDPYSSKGVYYSTDGGNNCHYLTSSGWCFNMKREGQTGTNLVYRWAGYRLLCM